MLPLTTDRLLLRRWHEDDRDAYAALNADPVVMEYYPSTLSRTESDRSFDTTHRIYDRQGFGLAAVEHRASGRVIGVVGLHVPTFDAPFTPCVEIGWKMAADIWGNGFATEAAVAVRDWAFTEGNIDELVSMTAIVNLRSIALMERLGMTRDPEADFEHPRVPAGSHLRPHVLYRLPRAVWQQDQRRT